VVLTCLSNIRAFFLNVAPPRLDVQVKSLNVRAKRVDVREKASTFEKKASAFEKKASTFRQKASTFNLGGSTLGLKTPFCPPDGWSVGPSAGESVSLQGKTANPRPRLEYMCKLCYFFG
jgi:hypothetical protein